MVQGYARARGRFNSNSGAAEHTGAAKFWIVDVAIARAGKCNRSTHSVNVAMPGADVGRRGKQHRRQKFGQSRQFPYVKIKNDALYAAVVTPVVSRSDRRSPAAVEVGDCTRKLPRVETRCPKARTTWDDAQNIGPQLAPVPNKHWGEERILGCNVLRLSGTRVGLNWFETKKVSEHPDSERRSTKPCHCPRRDRNPATAILAREALGRLDSRCCV
ncbi:hypothetical protein C8R44DRAFT_744281 [Mycena epipterygia]|nr:hypothetical protein C8R44DRAFT_744281 [Mycena epipterygia]